MTIVLTFVSIVLLQSIVACTASRPGPEVATSSAVGIDRPNQAPNTVELLQDMQEKMSTFQEQLDKQATTIARQELQLQSQKREIEGFKQLVKTQQQRYAKTNARQELKLQSQKREIEGFKQLVKTQQEKIDTHAKHMVTMQKRLLTKLSRKFKQRLDKMSNEITEMAASIPKETNPPSRITRQVQAENVAFSAYLTTEIYHLPGGHIIQMRGVHLNEGNAYNPSDGIFTTPQNGVYLFSFTVTQDQVHQVLVTLVVDGSFKSMVASEPFHSGQDIQGTNVVLLRLTTGQQVWTEIDRGDTDDIVDGTSRYQLTTFSGVFLYP